MSGLECSFIKEAVAYTDQLINIDSAGLVDGDKPMWRGLWSFFQDDVNFTSYYQGLMYSYNQTAELGCNNHDYCLGVKPYFYWTGMHKYPWTFECPIKKECKFMIFHDGMGWSSIQSDSSHEHVPSHPTQAFDVRYLRHSDPPKLTLTFASFGPSKVQVLFNEVLVALKMKLMRERSAGYQLIDILRICQFNSDKLPEGTFTIRYKDKIFD